jgi:hypothetical protein
VTVVVCDPTIFVHARHTGESAKVTRLDDHAGTLGR